MSIDDVLQNKSIPELLEEYEELVTEIHPHSDPAFPLDTKESDAMNRLIIIEEYLEDMGALY